jgi:hypothetical protein
MSSYDLETRRLLCRERVDQLSRDARQPVRSRHRRRRLMQVVLGKLSLSPSSYRSRRPSLEG